MSKPKSRRGSLMSKAEHTLVFKTQEDRLRYIHRHDTWEDMLEALKMASKLGFTFEELKVHKAIEAAIAKAEGRE